MHAERQHAREPGDLLNVLANTARPLREGHKPNGGRVRSGLLIEWLGHQRVLAQTEFVACRERHTSDLAQFS